MDGISLSAKGLTDLFVPGSPPAIAAMAELRW
jgi:hypothetical protein